MNPQPEINNKQSTILVVDDDPYVLDSIAVLLRGYNYTVIPCRNAEQAINVLQKTRIDVVLSDINMPQVSGFELLEIINNFNTGIPVILMTAYAGLEVGIEATKKGAFHLIPKPYKSKNLFETIEEADKKNKKAL